MADLASDRRYCDTVLPRVSRTFAINIRLLSGSMREAVQTAYLLCRISDALEDSWPGRPDDIRARFEILLEAVAGNDRSADRLARDAAGIGGDGADLELVRHLPSVWRVFVSLPATDRAAIGEALGVMARGMSRYAARAVERGDALPYLDTEAELDDYCWVVAGCVGVMLTRLHAARDGATAADLDRRIALAPLVGRALQLTNILLDWPRDVRRGRCYLPATWLAGPGLAPADLVGAPRPGVKEIAERLEALARAALARVPDYLDLVPGRARRYRLFVLLPALWALRSIETARSEPEFPWGPRRPKLARGRLWGAGLAALGGRAALDALRRCATATAEPALR